MTTPPLRFGTRYLLMFVFIVLERKFCLLDAKQQSLFKIKANSDNKIGCLFCFAGSNITALERFARTMPAKKSLFFKKNNFSDFFEQITALSAPADCNLPPPK